MKMEKATREQVTRNVILSLFIFALPIAAMFTTFLITGQRPWEKKAHQTQKVKSVTTKNPDSNGSND